MAHRPRLMTGDTGSSARGTPAAGTVDLWSASLDPAQPPAAELERCLSPDERARAARFVSPRDGARFIAGRAFLRHLLSGYVGGTAAEVGFRYGPQGKPALDGEALSFNLAHSGGLAVCAVAASGVGVGVDVELIRTLQDARAIERMVLSPAELVALDSLPEADRQQRFFACWTCKEAVLKARGYGLARPLDRVELVFDTVDSPRVHERLDPLEQPRPFSLRIFSPASGYVGAVAIDAALATLREQTWHWD